MRPLRSTASATRTWTATRGRMDRVEAIEVCVWGEATGAHVGGGGGRGRVGGVVQERDESEKKRPPLPPLPLRLPKTETSPA